VARGRYLFLPGWGATAGIYRRGLPQGWDLPQPPSFRATRGELRPYRDWIVDLLREGDEPAVLAGHSMGGALAVLAAADVPERVSALVLISPSGLPLQKTIPQCARTFAAQVAQGLYPPGELARSAVQVARAPRAAFRLAETLRNLDLSREMELVRAAGIPTTVIGCSTDTLVTVDHCRRSAALLGASSKTLTLADGHMWMLRGWRRLKDELAAARIEAPLEARAAPRYGART
jgi:pimeloyl-ACP methyl ester carboxylesterase